MLACTETITVVRYDDERYTATAISGVSWFNKTRVKLADNGLAFANTVSIRIPEEAITSETVLPAVGDHIILGALAEGEAISGPADLAARHARKVMAVGDNRRGRLPHVAVVGQ